MRISDWSSDVCSSDCLRDVLMARSSIKNELRVERTMIRAAENNPLKFSVNEEEALSALLLTRSPGFLPPVQATRQGFDDIKAHEMAVMAGMQAALGAMLKLFDPATLTQRLAKKIGSASCREGVWQDW